MPGTGTNANYRLCVFEHSNFGQFGARDIAIGQLVLDWFTAAAAEPLG